MHLKTCGSNVGSPEVPETKPIAHDRIYRTRGFDAEIIVLCVRGYITYRLSYRDLAEMMAERGVHVAHSTILRWVTRYVPEFEKRSNRFSITVGTASRVNETCLSIKAKSHYLYRAADKRGRTVDFRLRRDHAAPGAAQSHARRSRAEPTSAVAAAARTSVLAKRDRADEPIPEQHHRARPSGDQTALRIDGRVQVV
jgi:transposase-like protein